MSIRQALQATLCCIAILLVVTPAVAQKLRKESLPLVSTAYQQSIVSAYQPSENSIVALRKWQEYLRTISALPKRERPGELDLHERFFTEVFVDALGYQKRQGTETDWTIGSEYHTDVDKTRPDGLLGRFAPEDTSNVQVVIELKGFGTNLNLRQNRQRDRRTPIDQAFSYAHKFDDVKWVIVSNYNELRLYHHRSSKYALTFDLTTINNPDQASQLRLFLLLLRKENMLATPGELSKTDQLFAKREAELEAITDEFYQLYKAVRLATWREIRSQHVDSDESIRLAQKIIDRVLFIAFLEDKGLLQPNIIAQATQVNKFANTPIWENYKGLFRGLDKGDDTLQLPAFNGGLFKSDSALDSLHLSDGLMHQYAKLASYDFASDLSVKILGHVFEQSITDLSLLRAEAAGEEVDNRRQREGAYYTPDFVAEFVVESTIAPYLATIRRQLGEDSLPELSDAELSTTKQSRRKQQHIAFWQAYLERLQTLRVLDPSCGSGVFLVTAYDFLVAESERIHAELAQLGVNTPANDFRRDLLQNNLYGVDISAEAVQITKLSLWLKVANDHEPLVSLEHMLAGNAVVDDPAIDPENAFHWHNVFPEVMADGGFDIIIGNPPYVRHELIKDWKPALKNSFETYRSSADLYVYFFELGHKLLKPGGKLGYISSNQFFRVGYGAGLRRFLTERTRIEAAIDLSQHKDIFHDAQVSTAIVIFEKSPPWEGKVLIRTPLFDNQTSYMPSGRLDSGIWSLEDEGFFALRTKMQVIGTPLADWPNTEINIGVGTGYDRAFVITTEKRNELVAQDPKSAEIIKPLLRGRNINRWHYQESGMWLIFTRRGINIGQYSAIERHLRQYYDFLRPRNAGQTTGRRAGVYEWYEIQSSIVYFANFDRDKIIFPSIKKSSAFALDTDGKYGLGSTFIIIGDDLEYLLAVLNSRLVSWYAYKNFSVLNGGGIQWKKVSVETIPIPRATKSEQQVLGELAQELTGLHRRREQIRSRMLDTLQSDYSIGKPTTDLANWPNLKDGDAFIAAVTKSGARLTTEQEQAAVRTFDTEIVRVRTLDAAITTAEGELNLRVEDLYGLTEAERSYYRAGLINTFPE